MTTMTINADYDKATAWLNGRQHKKLANNTYARLEDDGRIVVKYHDTDILTYHPNGEVEYQSGGWLTYTTKDRFNRFGAEAIRLSQDKGRWFVHGRIDETYGRLTDFYDGMRVRDGQVTTELRRSGDPDKAIKAKIKRYVAGYTDEEIRRLVEKGGAGDCWFCMMRTEDGTPLGDVHGDTDHLLSHLDEGYRMIHLAYNAVKEAGYRDPMFIIQVSPDNVRKSIRKYLMARLATNTARRIPGGGGWGGPG